MMDLFLFLMTIVMIDGWALYQLMSRGLFVRLTKVNTLQSIAISGQGPVEAIRTRIAGEPWALSNSPMERCLGALRWTMNRTSTVEYNGEKDPSLLLTSLESGKGAVCSDMALLYSNVLSSIGVSSRIISLSRNIFDPFDSHETVEVLLNGKWVVMDPTFHVTFSDSSGQLLSAQEIKIFFLKGNWHEIQVSFHGAVAYPPRIEKYYMNVIPCFNNVFVVDPGTTMRPLMAPPLRYWFGPKWFYEKLSRESVSHLDFAKRLYFYTVIILPFAILVALLMIAIQFFP